MERRTARQVWAGNVGIGGNSPISVQTMTKAAWEDVDNTLLQIRQAREMGCTLARLAVPSIQAAGKFGEIAAVSPLPLVADTHFDYRVTLAAIEAGAAKVRINPGNMDKKGLVLVAQAAKERGIPIRVGGNSGSIRHNRPGDERDLAQALAEESLGWAGQLEELGFQDIVISLKAPDAATTVAANRLVAKASDYPLHLGVTAAGPREDSLLKSAAAIGSLLLDGIGDTIRFSFTGPPLEEVAAGVDLLRALGLSNKGLNIMSCPTCGRCRVDLVKMAALVKDRLRGVDAPLTVAVMGCEVNGPGEAKVADAGLASAGGRMVLFRQGETLGVFPEGEAVEKLVGLVKEMAAALGAGSEG